MRIKNFIIVLLAFATSFASAQIKDYSAFDEKFNFYFVTDLGRNGYYDQKPIAELMGTMADEIGPEFVVATGDTHHYDGIRSVQDPIWQSNFEEVYRHPELLVEWYPILGNHEYRGNTQAVIDYSRISRRWNMPGRYYTKSFTSEEDGATVRLVLIDTPSLIDKYRNEYAKYPDAGRQNMQEQLNWLETVLVGAKEDWVIVAGHHPVYADTSKDDIERTNLQQRVDPILRRHQVDMYVCGHIHNFQHIRRTGSDIDYVVNSSGSLSRKVKSIEGTQFCSGETGFSVCSVSKKELKFYLIDNKGNILHTISRKK